MLKHLVMFIVPILESRYVIEVVLTVLEHIASRTETTLDDEIVKNIRRMV